MSYLEVEQVFNDVHAMIERKPDFFEGKSKEKLLEYCAVFRKCLIKEDIETLEVFVVISLRNDAVYIDYILSELFKELKCVVWEDLKRKIAH